MQFSQLQCLWTAQAQYKVMDVCAWSTDCAEDIDVFINGCRDELAASAQDSTRNCNVRMCKLVVLNMPFHDQCFKDKGHPCALCAVTERTCSFSLGLNEAPVCSLTSLTVCKGRVEEGQLDRLLAARKVVRSRAITGCFDRGCSDLLSTKSSPNPACFCFCFCSLPIGFVGRHERWLRFRILRRTGRSGQI